MGVRKRYWYTIECNHCGLPLEDYAGDIAGLTNTKEQAEGLAKEYGWLQTGKNTWKCPGCCATERRYNNEIGRC